MSHPNQQNNQPILPYLKSAYKIAPIRRSTILDNTIKTFYGPGQPPDAGEPTSYSAPTDWPESGTPLSVPQVIWFLINIPYAFIEPPPQEPYNHVLQYPQIGINFVSSLPRSFDEWYGFTNYDPSTNTSSQYVVESTGKVTKYTFFGTTNDPDHVPTGSAVILEAGSDPPDGDGWYTYDFQVRPNVYQIERNRLNDVFNTVKDKLKKLRPNRTYINWVEPLELVHWSQSFFEGGLSTNPSYILNYDRDRPTYFLNMPYDSDSYFLDLANNSIPPQDKVYPYSVTVEYLWHLICPNVELGKADYFGTNFLMIHCGFISTTQLMLNAVFPDQQMDNNGETYVDKIDRLTETMMPYLLDAQSYFAGYSVRFFGLDLVFEEFEPLETTTFEEHSFPHYSDVRDVDITGETTGLDPTGYRPIGWVRQTDETYGNQQIEFFTNFYNSGFIDSANTFPELQMSANTELLIDAATYLTNVQKLDYQYVDTTNKITVEYLMQLIADHFKFNVLTGEDK